MGKHYSVRNKHNNWTCLTTLLYEDTITGVPSSITFNSEYFVRPGTITIPHLLTNLKQNGINTTIILTSPPTILNDHYRKYLFQTVDINNLSTWILPPTFAPTTSLPCDCTYNMRKEKYVCTIFAVLISLYANSQLNFFHELMVFTIIVFMNAQENIIKEK